MTKEDVSELQPGLYRLYWKVGGLSVAAVGMTEDGRHWFTPTNWTYRDTGPGSPTLPSFDWDEVEKVELITTQQEERDKHFQPPTAILLKRQVLEEQAAVLRGEMIANLAAVDALEKSCGRHLWGPAVFEGRSYSGFLSGEGKDEGGDVDEDVQALRQGPKDHPLP